MRTRNEVIVGGRIVYIDDKSERRTIFGVVAITPLKGRTNETRESFVIFTYPGKLPEDIQKNDRVLVNGHVITPERISPEGKRERATTFIADSIKKQESELEAAFGIKGSSYPMDVNCARFCGTVVTSFQSKNDKWGHLLIQVDEDRIDRTANRILLDYPKLRRLPDFEYKGGDRVFVVATINTAKKDVDGKARTFKDFIIDDIKKISVEEQNDP